MLRLQDNEKERDTTENLLERVDVEDILELKQQQEEDAKLKASALQPHRQPLHALWRRAAAHRFSPRGDPRRLERDTSPRSEERESQPTSRPSACGACVHSGPAACVLMPERLGLSVLDSAAAERAARDFLPPPPQAGLSRALSKQVAPWGDLDN